MQDEEQGNRLIRVHEKRVEDQLYYPSVEDTTKQNRSCRYQTNEHLVSFAMNAPLLTPEVDCFAGTIPVVSRLLLPIFAFMPFSVALLIANGLIVK